MIRVNEDGWKLEVIVLFVENFCFAIAAEADFCYDFAGKEPSFCFNSGVDQGCT